MSLWILSGPGRRGCIEHTPDAEEQNKDPNDAAPDQEVEQPRNTKDAEGDETHEHRDEVPKDKDYEHGAPRNRSRQGSTGEFVLLRGRLEYGTENR